MIKANELRIGNIVKYFLGVTDDGAEYKTHTVNAIDLVNNVIDLEPIPLTEEILLKCGFEQHVKYFTLKIGLSFFTNKPINFRVSHTKFDNYLVMSPANSSIHLKSVHQLQNLYFCLIGQELEIKL